MSTKQRLLMTTQIVDLDDPYLGFAHRWIEELAKHYESIEVICLKEGRHALPHNVRVHSLGKEHGVSRAAYVWRFLGYIWKLRRAYDAVFVHMNQEYVLLGGLYWRLSGKRVYLWRNHYVGNWLTNIAVAISTKVFCTSTHSYTARFKKTTLMPVGVDTDLFSPQRSTDRRHHSILSLGRVAPSKNVHVLIEALGLLKKQEVDFAATICGPVSDPVYIEQLEKRARNLGIGHMIQWRGGVSHDKTPAVYTAHEIFVNLSKSGMYDKTIFEAAASGSLVLTTSRDFSTLVDKRLILNTDTPEEVAEKLRVLLSLQQHERERLQQDVTSVAQSHSLGEWGRRIALEIKA